MSIIQGLWFIQMILAFWMSGHSYWLWHQQKTYRPNSRFVDSPSKRYYNLFTCMAFLMGLWSLLLFLIESFSQWTLILIAYESIAILMLIMSMLLYAYAHFIKYGQPVIKVYKIIGISLIIVTILIIATNPLHQLYKRSVTQTMHSAMTLIQSDLHILYYVIMGMVILLLAFSSIHFMTAYAKNQPSLNKHREFSLVFISLLPIFFYMVYQLFYQLNILLLDITPIMITLSLCMSYGLFILPKNVKLQLLRRNYWIDMFHQGILFIDHQQHILDFNEYFLKLINYNSQQLYGKQLGTVTHPLLKLILDLIHNPAGQNEYTEVIGKKAIIYKIEYQRLDSEDIKTHGYLISVTDITAYKESENQLNYLMSHDTLTGVYNRRHFDITVDHMNQYPYFPLGIMVCEVNNLKAINALKGYLVGDETLQHTAKGLLSLIPDHGLVCRIGSDEFALIMPNTNGSELARLKEHIQEEIHVRYGLTVDYYIKLSTDTSLSDMLKKAH